MSYFYRLTTFCLTLNESPTLVVHVIHRGMRLAGLWGVINNAGINVVGEVEFTTVALYERGLGVNMYGPVRIIKGFLPLIRASRGIMLCCLCVIYKVQKAFYKYRDQDAFLRYQASV